MYLNNNKYKIVLNPLYVSVFIYWLWLGLYLFVEKLYFFIQSLLLTEGI